jgi:hypothetical protein
MTYLYTPHGHNAAKVRRVMTEMRRLGAPEIRVVDCGDHYYAIEGVHRLAAAARLGVAPKLIVLDQDDELDLSTLDVDLIEPPEGGITAGELVAQLTSMSGCYAIADDGRLSLVFNGGGIPDEEE